MRKPKAEEARPVRAGAGGTPEEWRLLDEALNVVEAGVILFDRSLCVVWMNSGMPKDLLLVEPGQVVGRPCKEVLRAEASDCDECQAPAFAGSESSFQIIKKVHGTESVRDFLRVVRVLREPGAMGAHLMEVYVDITVRQDAQRALARTQELVRNILNSSVDGILATDMKGRITLFNRAAETIFGYTENEVLGVPVYRLYRGGTAEAASVMARLREEEVITDLRTAFRAKGGEMVPLRITASLLRDEERTLQGTMAFFQDLRTEESLKREMASRDQYFLSILQASMDGLVTLDPEGRVASWNRGATAIFGLEPAKALGRPMDDVLPPKLLREMPSSAATQGPTRHYEASLGDGAGRVDLLVTRTELTEEGSPAGASIVLKDVTELKRLEQDLAQSENLAELGRLAASVAHEIKNPIAGLRGAMEMMSGVHMPDDPRFTVFQEALAQMRRLDSLVRDLLAFAKPVSVRREPTPLHLVAEASMPFVEPGAQEGGVSVQVDLSPDLPLVMADPQQLQQVVVNLLVNAVQATPKGGRVRISAEVSGGLVSVAVEDTGGGIKPEIMANIFKPFFTTKHIGTGLGLSIVQRIVNAHGGRIDIRTREGEGSTFTVHLPVAAGSA